MAAHVSPPTVSQPTTSKIDIHEAAGEGRLSDVKAYLKTGGLIDKRDDDRWTPLMMAVREGHLEVAKVLLRSGATLEARDTDKWTAMHVVAANGHPQCCQLLLDRGGNPRALDENRRTPLHWATRYGYAAVVELLLRRGADANFKDSDGKTPLDVIGVDLAEDAREIVRTLLLEHAEKMKSTKQRRGSCPAIPRTALISAIDASGLEATATASTPQAKMPEGTSQPFLPLPAVTVVRSAADPAEPSGSGREDAPGNADQAVVPIAAAGVVRKGNRRGSFSSAAHIRDHPFRQGKSQAAPGASSPEEATPKSSIRGQVPGHPESGAPLDRDIHDNSETSNSATQTTAIAVSEGAGGGASPNDGGGGGRHHNEDKGQDDDVIAMLKRALQAAEKRAQEAEQSRSDEEVWRRREEARVRALEERVADLEEKLKQTDNGCESVS